MTHRADQILEAVKEAHADAAIALGVPTRSMHIHRTQSLSDDQGELPAITFNFGDDAPADEFDGFDQVASQLDVLVDLYCVADNEEAAKTELMRLRTESHKALVVNSSLGLSFILALRYGGARAPAISTDGNMTAATLTTLWRVVYWMPTTDPS